MQRVLSRARVALPRGPALSSFSSAPSSRSSSVTALKEASRRIFGSLPTEKECRRTGVKVLKQTMNGRLLASYEPPRMKHVIRMFYPGIGVDDERERRLDQIDRRKRKGKTIPKKGEGKRAGQKKKK